MTLTEQLLTVSREFCAGRGLSASRVSTLVFNDGKKLAAIEGGADLQTAKFEHAMVWFSSHWPDGAEWPLGIPRPAPQAEAAE